MSVPFDRHLNVIANRITIRDEERKHRTKDFDGIRDYMFKIMRDYDSDFNMICKGHSLFGSYSNNVRISQANEFDVHMLLSFPFSRYINIEEDEHRPGFVFLNLFNVMDELENVNGYDDIYELLNEHLLNKNYYLRRTSLQLWITRIIKNALNCNSKMVRGPSGILYELEYSKRGLAHTVYAHARTQRGAIHNISIDFVPAVMFGQAEWMTIRNYHPFRYKCERWYAVPKPVDGPKRTRKYAFMICCPKVEHDLLLGRQNLKVVFRLLKSFRNAYILPRLKSYFLTTVFLWEIEKQNDDFWYRPLSELFIHMLDVLSDYFLDEFLPFFWNENLNLLDILSKDEIEAYTKELYAAYKTLETYKDQPKLTLSRTETHFEIPEGR